jgi:hypothetical protein
MPRDARNRQTTPRWIFLAKRRSFHLIHVSRTTDGIFASTGHTSRLWKLLEGPSKTWFKNMFVLVLLFLEAVPKLKLWWALNVLARYFRKLIQNEHFAPPVSSTPVRFVEQERKFCVIIVKSLCGYRNDWMHRPDAANSGTCAVR